MQTVQDVFDDRKVTARQFLIFGVCLFIALIDGFDTQSIAFTGPAIADDFGFEATDMAPVITASTIGMVIGAMTLGTMGDRIGRRKTLVYALVVIGVFSFIAAFSTALWQIVLLRFLIGIGMGGATPALLALSAEFAPLRLRGTVMTITLLGLPGGAMIGGLVAAAWLPILGWRGIFLLGGVLPLLMVPLALLLLRESPSFLVSRGRSGDQERARGTIATITGQPVIGELTPEARTVNQGSVGQLFSPRFRLVTITIWVTYLFNWISWFLLLQWLPTALNLLGLGADQAALGTVTVNAAFIAFAIPLSVILPRVKAKKVLLVMFAVGILVSIGLGLAGQNWALVFTLIALAGFGVGGGQLALNYLIAMIYPTELRSTATGWSIGIGRTGSVIGSAIGGVLLASLGVGLYFMILAIPLALAALATLLVPQTAAHEDELQHHEHVHYDEEREGQ